MNTHETIGGFLLALAVALAGLQLLAASYHAGIREGRRREASRNLNDMIQGGEQVKCSATMALACAALADTTFLSPNKLAARGHRYKATTKRNPLKTESRRRWKRAFAGVCGGPTWKQIIGEGRE